MKICTFKSGSSEMVGLPVFSQNIWRLIFCKLNFHLGNARGDKYPQLLSWYEDPWIDAKFRWLKTVHLKFRWSVLLHFIGSLRKSWKWCSAVSHLTWPMPTLDLFGTHPGAPHHLVLFGLPCPISFLPFIIPVESTFIVLYLVYYDKYAVIWRRFEIQWWWTS